MILSIKRNQAKNSFYLISSAASPTFKVVVKEAISFIRRVTPAPSTTFIEAIAKCCLFYEDSAVLTLTTLGRIPKLNVLGLVDTEAYNGTYKANLFNFQHYNLTQVGVYVDGEQIPWINPCS